MPHANPFDAIAGEYAAIRPGYPDAAFDFVVGAACLPPGTALLEVGVGTGQATTGFAQRGFAVTGLEPGPALAAEARRRLAAYPRVDVQEATFEQWNPRGRRFQMLYAAQAYHWVEPLASTTKPLDVLTDRGWIALLWNIPQARPDSPLHDRIGEAYRRNAPGLRQPGAGAAAKAARDVSARLDECGAYELVAQRSFPWTRSYGADDYKRLLGTFSDHLGLPPRARAALLDEIAGSIEAAGKLEAEYETECFLYRRL